VNAQVVEILILAVVAGVVLARLYAVLGRRTGAERPVDPRPQPVGARGDMRRREVDAPAPAPVEFAGPAGDGLSAIQAADASFDPTHFIAGARQAYELIVNAYASGDREALRPLLTERVFTAYANAIEQREATGEQGPELVRLKSADFVDASLENGVAKIAVRFEAELAHGQHGLRDTLEKWTFEREVRSRDPNWRLARVSAL
jgi:predicted lipid-binding transport protein (Tim44 family)